MRAFASLAIAAVIAVVAAATAGCSYLDDFGQFDVGGGCSNGCTCIAPDNTLGIPEHCAIAPANGISCSGHNAATLDLAGDYIVDTGDPLSFLSTPTFKGPGVDISGSVSSGVAAVFCVGSMVTSAPSKITVQGHRLLFLIADSAVRFQGAIGLGGDYALDEHGAGGGPGGYGGGDQGGGGSGPGGGSGGSGIGSGSGGAGAGASAGGGPGGAVLGGMVTPGGAQQANVSGGFGGGGGGAGTTKGGGGGGGGGALQITASWEVAFDQVTVDASGGGGAAGAAGPPASTGAGGGGGGGSGGALWLEAPTVRVNGGCLSVIGGPGGGGGGAGRGSDARPASGCGYLGSAGEAGIGGGAGAVPAMSAGSLGAGGNASGNGGGGGGSGAYGHVVIRARTPPQIAGVVPAAAYSTQTLP